MVAEQSASEFMYVPYTALETVIQQLDKGLWSNVNADIDAACRLFFQHCEVCSVCYCQELLACSEKTITDITFEVGYKDITHFTRTFKKYTGLSPSAYRVLLME